MQDGEIADDRLERGVLEGQGLRVRLAEVDAGMRTACELTIAPAMSTPTTDAPRAAARPATYPGPVATSSTRVPAPTDAASRSGSATWLVIEPNTRS